MTPARQRNLGPGCEGNAPRNQTTLRWIQKLLWDMSLNKVHEPEANKSGDAAVMCKAHCNYRQDRSWMWSVSDTRVFILTGSFWAIALVLPTKTPRAIMNKWNVQGWQTLPCCQSHWEINCDLYDLGGFLWDHVSGHIISVVALRINVYLWSKTSEKV